MKVRLLNPSIYRKNGGERDPMFNSETYPVIVEGSIKDSYGMTSTGRINVTAQELDRAMPYPDNFKRASCIKELGWWNNPVRTEPGAPEISWELVSPFDYWNKLKSSRPVGDVVPAGYL